MILRERFRIMRLSSDSILCCDLLIRVLVTNAEHEALSSNDLRIANN
jgi:hypothetical protein